MLVIALQPFFVYAALIFHHKSLLISSIFFNPLNVLIRGNVHSDFITITNCLVVTVIPPLLNKGLKVIKSVIASVSRCGMC